MIYRDIVIQKQLPKLYVIISTLCIDLDWFHVVCWTYVSNLQWTGLHTTFSNNVVAVNMMSVYVVCIICRPKYDCTLHCTLCEPGHLIIVITGCHRLADFMDSVKQDSKLGAKLFKMNCDDHKYGHSCFKFAGMRMFGKGTMLYFAVLYQAWRTRTNEN